MKKAIWILFVTLTLIWTGFAFLAAGIARWTSDAIASDRFAETTQYVALTSERMTQKVADASVRAAEQVATTMTQAVGEEQRPVDGSTAAVTAPVAPTDSAPILPPIPPLPEWVNQWLAPEMVQSIKEWGVWAKTAAHAGKTAVADAANATARAVPEAARQETTQSTTMTSDAAAQSSKAVDAPWLADVVGWLVPIVWVIWGIGMILGLLLTLIAQWGVSRFVAAHP
jgi:hypothetical protein